MKEYSDAKKNKIKKRVLAWTEEFEGDKRYKSLTDSQKEESGFIIDVFADLMYGYFLQEPAEWDAAALEECCLDLLPRKVSAELIFYQSVEPVLTGFFEFLQEKGHITKAPALISRLKKVSGTMIKLADDPKNWGPAKSLAMGAIQAGINMEDPGAIDRYVQMVNMMNQKAAQAVGFKAGRNEPCPCGSGKKYKKCCGAAGNTVPFPIASAAAADTENAVYQLKITLKDIKPPIWRRVLVPGNITFHKLHKIMQAAFGWQDYHLFDFDFGDMVAHIPDPDYTPGELYGDVKALNAKRTKIDSLLTERGKCIYTYDFGDVWRHEIVLEKTLPAKEGERYPVCLEGARHRPPEDVGGVPGYEEFLNAIRNPKHPEHDDYLVWAEKDTGGRKFDPEYFYINETNRALAKIK